MDLVMPFYDTNAFLLCCASWAIFHNSVSYQNILLQILGIKKGMEEGITLWHWATLFHK